MPHIQATQIIDTYAHKLERLSATTLTITAAPLAATKCTQLYLVFRRVLIVLISADSTHFLHISVYSCCHCRPQRRHWPYVVAYSEPIIIFSSPCPCANETLIVVYIRVSAMYHSFPFRRKNHHSLGDVVIFLRGRRIVLTSASRSDWEGVSSLKQGRIYVARQRVSHSIARPEACVRMAWWSFSAISHFSASSTSVEACFVRYIRHTRP